MRREEMTARLREDKIWDIIITGGGATGLGIAIDAAARGYSTLLLEKYDFAKGTSSRSTKLVHGGVRYLAQGNIKLVREALRERGLLLKNAPHLTRKLAFIVPSYHWWEKWYYGTGLKLYDLLSGKLGIGKTEILSAPTVLQRLPVAEKKGLSGGIGYFDGQFDDARLAINMAQTAVEQGAVVINYMSVTGLLKDQKNIRGVEAMDMLDQHIYQLKAKVVINATGVFVDDVLRMEDAGSPGMVAPSQGVHIVLDKKFFPSDTALMIPRTADGRVLFAVPWHNRVVVGTTDTPVDQILAEPLPFREEISFIIYHFNKYLTSDIRESDIRSIFTGLRPLVKSSNTGNTSILSRDHTIVVSTGGLVTITGGKWTTYRKMAKDAVDNAAFVAKLEIRTCTTDKLRIHGWVETADEADSLYGYGSDADHIKKLAADDPSLAEKLHPDFPYILAEVVWAIREEMAMTVEDVLARRLRLLFLDTRIAMEVAPAVARLMAGEMGKDPQWEKNEVEKFMQTAQGYLP
jgi:glycerol-3-phosphate dehydrogenase